MCASCSPFRMARLSPSMTAPGMFRHLKNVRVRAYRTLQYAYAYLDGCTAHGHGPLFCGRLREKAGPLPHSHSLATNTQCTLNGPHASASSSISPPANEPAMFLFALRYVDTRTPAKKVRVSLPSSSSPPPPPCSLVHGPLHPRVLHCRTLWGEVDSGRSAKGSCLVYLCT